MIELLIATKNHGKLIEIERVFADSPIPIKLYYLSDFGISSDCPENGQTFEENATIKSLFYGAFQPNIYTVGDDSGLSVDVLNGAPGVYSARYAGTPSSDERNTAKLLDELTHISNRKAKFVTTVCLSKNNRVIRCFTGEAEGIIIDEKRGTNGFGYDPVFLYPPRHKTFAELTTEEKNQVSHRAKAFHQLKVFMESLR
ncbi:MAG: RdgB/HAM1 family non-canonical purine NTP pyrophosphatase [Candidatus Omnitrophota bacterium]